MNKITSTKNNAQIIQHLNQKYFKRNEYSSRNNNIGGRVKIIQDINRKHSNMMSNF